MPELSRAQLLVYGAIAVALLLVGVRWVRVANGAEEGRATGTTAAAERGSAGAGKPFVLERAGGDVVVHVAGAVREPGVYRLPEGSRVTDALERAGGATRNAAADAINLAAPLADGQQVQVPAAAGPGSAAPSGAAASTSGPTSLGSATAEDLEAIEGVGPVTAQAILEFRDERGGVASIEELDEISGVGPATMDTLREALQP